MPMQLTSAAAPNTRRDWLRWAAGAGLPAALGTAHAATSQAPARPQFPNVPVVTHEGKTVRFYDDLVRGKVVVFNMMYTVCTGICPTNTANLLYLQESLGARLGREVFMYSMTLQPEFDDPRALREYRQRYGIKPGWTFLTGKPHEMDLLRRGLGFFDTDPAADADLRTHTGMIRAGNDTYNRWLMVPALTSPQRILRAVQRL